MFLHRPCVYWRTHERHLPNRNAIDYRPHPYRFAWQWLHIFYLSMSNYNVEYPMCQMSKSEVMIWCAFCGILHHGHHRKILGSILCVLVVMRCMVNMCGIECSSSSSIYWQHASNIYYIYKRCNVNISSGIFRFSHGLHKN